MSRSYCPIRCFLSPCGEIAADVALKLHAIQSADTARMTSEQYAEFVAEELADITYQVAANKVASTVKDSGIPQGFVRMTREMLKGDPEAAIAGGGSASASVAAPEEPSLQTFAKKKGHDGSAGNEAGNATNVLKQEGQNVKSGGDNHRLSHSNVKCTQKNMNGRTFVEIEHPVLDSVRSGSALKSDSYHAFDKIIDNFTRDAIKFEIKGKDGISRKLYQIEGSLNGESGVFEWIVDLSPEKGVTHRLFIKGGSITGKSNMIPRR